MKTKAVFIVEIITLTVNKMIIELNHVCYPITDGATSHKKNYKFMPIILGPANMEETKVLIKTCLLYVYYILIITGSQCYKCIKEVYMHSLNDFKITHRKN